MDESANSFLEKYSTDEEAAADVIKVHATDSMMPLTTISEEEMKKIEEALTYLSGGLWDTYMSD